MLQPVILRGEPEIMTSDMLPTILRFHGDRRSGRSEMERHRWVSQLTNMSFLAVKTHSNPPLRPLKAIVIKPSYLNLRQLWNFCKM